MFRQGQPLRRWAARVLLLWLLGLAVPMAHACIGMGSADTMVAVDLADGSDCAAHHGSAGKTNCQDFCSKASVSMPSQKTVLDDLQHLALFAVVALAALPLPVLRPARARVPRLGGAHAPPIPIAFLRLTR